VAPRVDAPISCVDAFPLVSLARMQHIYPQAAAAFLELRNDRVRTGNQWVGFRTRQVAVITCSCF
jgi:hypothetical protein